MLSMVQYNLGRPLMLFPSSLLFGFTLGTCMQLSSFSAVLACQTMYTIQEGKNANYQRDRKHNGYAGKESDGKVYRA